MGKPSVVTKMTAARHQEVKAAEILEVKDDEGTQVRMVSGSFWVPKGPVEGITQRAIHDGT